MDYSQVYMSRKCQDDICGTDPSTLDEGCVGVCGVTTPDTLHPLPCTLYPTPHTLHLTPDTKHPYQPVNLVERHARPPIAAVGARFT